MSCKIFQERPSLFMDMHLFNNELPCGVQILILQSTWFQSWIKQQKKIFYNWLKRKPIHIFKMPLKIFFTILNFFCIWIITMWINLSIFHRYFTLWYFHCHPFLFWLLKTQQQMGRDFTFHLVCSLQVKVLANVVQMFSGMMNLTEINP